MKDYLKMSFKKLWEGPKDKNEDYSPEMIDYELDTAKDLVSEEGSLWISISLSFLPENIIDFITENIVFIENYECYISFKQPFFKNKIGIIFLTDHLWKKNRLKILFTIAHEVAHAYKGDNIEMSLKSNFKQSMKMEKRADKLAVTWLNKYFPKDKLLKQCEYLKKR